MSNQKTRYGGLFCVLINSSFSSWLVKAMERLGFSSFWVNFFLWLPCRLAMFEIKLEYGSLENFVNRSSSLPRDRERPPER
ncbi:hypothetical protein [Nitrosomonas eutropha]|uniref:Uncharacterized protein n=2 Tax=Nitrosomonas eutropha TaxID=916 RepID=A0ABX5M3P7_9PROT|nr:hypothetical protein [Nitrosomonas eutropha]ABI59477.1 conserved hypothetical protein [Nitrosomonas eutropha C91]PXV75032.1 hypothetical protein C8R14_1414 [Nitrosomonas eutropha]SCX08417.1 hypothetical protein SAMN05216379_1054 [Nitrosomonas eutropha]SEI37173.1 hypothetical protein SAMN05216318_1014 [Nitrosomonas eutropha]